MNITKLWRRSTICSFLVCRLEEPLEPPIKATLSLMCAWYEYSNIEPIDTKFEYFFRKRACCIPVLVRYIFVRGHPGITVQTFFVVRNRGSVVESDFYTKLKKLDIQKGKRDKLFADQVTQVCEAHNRVIVSFFQQVQGGTRPTTEGSRRTLCAMCTCEEIDACNASKLGPVERWWTQDGKLGITIQDPPPESGRRTHLLYCTYSYCILSRVWKLATLLLVLRYYEHLFLFLR